MSLKSAWKTANKIGDTPFVEGIFAAAKAHSENAYVNGLDEVHREVYHELSAFTKTPTRAVMRKRLVFQPDGSFTFWAESHAYENTLKRVGPSLFTGYRMEQHGQGRFAWVPLTCAEHADNDLIEITRGLVDAVSDLPFKRGKLLDGISREVALDGKSLARAIETAVDCEDWVVYGVQPASNGTFRVEAGPLESRPVFYDAQQFSVTAGKPVSRPAILTALEDFAKSHQNGRTIVAYDEVENSAIAARLDPMTAKLRKMMAQRLGCSTWDLQVQMTYVGGRGNPRLERVDAKSNKVSGKDSEARLNKWRDCISLFSSEPRAYRVTEAIDGTVSFTFFDDALKRLANYDWSAEFSLSRVPFAMDENGALISMALIESNILLGGIPGGGKSGGSTALIAGMSQIENVALIGLDPKMVELLPWRDRFSIVATEDDHASFVLAALLAEMDRRYIWLSENYDATKAKKFSESMINLEHPLLVVVIDELAELVSGGSTKLGVDEQKFRASAIRRLIAKGRAAGIVVDTATQKPGSDIIPTSLRDLIAQRVAYSTSNPQMTETILGQGSASAGGLAHTIAAAEKGVCYIINEGSREPVRARTFWIPDEDIPDLVAKTKHLKVTLPWLPTQDEARQEVAAASGKAVEWAAVLPAPNRGGGNQLAVAGRQVMPLPDQSVHNIWALQYATNLSDVSAVDSAQRHQLVLAAPTPKSPNQPPPPSATWTP